MKKVFSNIFLVSTFFLCSPALHAQVLFTFGNHPVTKNEFLRAYNKNNTEVNPTLQSYRDYLNLFIRFKIKVQAAKDKRMDTLPNQRSEVASFRSQVVESFMNDEASIKVMVDEAVERSRKDLHLAHIFVALPQNAGTDLVAAAQKKINLAFELLNKGEVFEKTAVAYSEDPAVSRNRGDVGMITVFVLPYELENLAYSTPVGKYSSPFRSSFGLHIFKNLGERKSQGRLRVAQILLAFPPEASEFQKKQLKERADSLRNVLLKDGDIKILASAFSADNLTYENGGELPEFGTGRYETTFEEAAFALKEGEISQPVLTSYGYHLLKLLRHIPLMDDKNNKQAREAVKQQVLQSDRMEVAKKVLLESVMKLTKFKKYPFSQQHFQSFTDSTIKNGHAPAFADLKPSTPLFRFEKQLLTVKDWSTWLKSVRELESVQQPAMNLLNEYIETVALEYYRNHLEEFNSDFASQLKEFRDGNLLFEIMQRNIWDVAASDTNGLMHFYQANRNKYWWETSADALIFTAVNEAFAEQLKTKLQGNVHDWRKYADSSAGQIQADSGRFELSQLPIQHRTNFTKDLITASVKNETDNSINFAYIIRMHSDKAPRTFEEARGFVINDYQNYLEEKWITTLKKKYPVKVNEAVLQSLIK